MRHTHMSTRALVLLLGVLALTAACAVPHAVPAGTAAPRSAAGRGTLHGRLVTVGGASPGAPKAVAGTVTVTGSGLRREVEVGPDGVYSVSLPAGDYTVVGHSPLVLSDSEPIPCPARKAARVTPGSAVALDAICSIK